MVEIIFIPPGDFDEEAIIEEVEKQLEIEVKRVRDLYDNTVRTWSRKPPFKTDIERGDDIIIDIGADTGTEGGKIHHYLDFGTRVRHALMEDGYARKTRVGQVGSWPAGGNRRPVYVSRKVQRPGIDARNWTALISYRRAGPAQTNLRRAFARGANRVFK